MDDHLLYFIAVQFVDVICLTDELDEGGHGRRHFGDEYHSLEVFWKNTFQGGHLRKVGDNFL